MDNSTKVLGSRMIRKRPAVLIVDDEEAVCELVCELLATGGYVCEVASNANEALAKLDRYSFDVALLDIRLPGTSGMDLLKTVDKCHQTTVPIMMTAINDIDTAVEAMRLGASDYILKPFTIDKLMASISRALHNRRTRCPIYDAIPNWRDPRHGHGSSLSEIDAIAYGVEARVDDLDCHSKLVTEETVELARLLGLSEREIDKWVTAQEKLHSVRSRHIKSISSKLEQNPVAQAMLGLSRPVCKPPKVGGMQN